MTFPPKQSFSACLRTILVQSLHPWRRSQVSKDPTPRMSRFNPAVPGSRYSGPEQYRPNYQSSSNPPYRNMWTQETQFSRHQRDNPPAYNDDLRAETRASKRDLHRIDNPRSAWLAPPRMPPFPPTLPLNSHIHTSPGEEYPDLSPPHVIPKLLVLDLNGALIYRNKTDRRKAYPRPFLDCFLQYLFLPEPDTIQRPWEVFVWSSAQPHNVRGMVESAFGPKWSQGVWEDEDVEAKNQRTKNGEGRLLGVWARDKMGLTDIEYRNKTQTVKDLRKVISHVSHPPVQYDERTVVLLDDSPLKGVLQPWNQIVIPGYDKNEHRSSNQAAIRMKESDGKITAEDCDGLDDILLGVIGILDDLRVVDNVPEWVRGGGLMRHTNAPESLPSHDSFVHWFQDAEVLNHWKERGKSALKRKGITIDIGISDEMPSSPPRKERWRKIPRDVTESPRRYSPSRPTQSPPPDTEASIMAHESKDVSDASEKWRTFRAVDVAQYLQDIADRESPLTNSQRQVMTQAGNLLRNLGSDGSFDAPMSEEDMKLLGFYPNMCDVCLLETGQRASRLSRKSGENGHQMRKDAGKAEEWVEGNLPTQSSLAEQSVLKKRRPHPQEALTTEIETSKSALFPIETKYPTSVSKLYRKLKKNARIIQDLQSLIQTTEAGLDISRASESTVVPSKDVELHKQKHRLNQLLRNQEDYERRIKDLTRAATDQDILAVRSKRKREEDVENDPSFIVEEGNGGLSIGKHKRVSLREFILKTAFTSRDPTQEPESLDESLPNDQAFSSDTTLSHSFESRRLIFENDDDELPEYSDVGDSKQPEVEGESNFMNIVH